MSSLVLAGFCFIFLDQAYWQSIIAAKPTQGVWGFLCAMLSIFSVVVCYGTATGVASLVLQFRDTKNVEVGVG